MQPFYDPCADPRRVSVRGTGICMGSRACDETLMDDGYGLYWWFLLFVVLMALLMGYSRVRRYRRFNGGGYPVKRQLPVSPTVVGLAVVLFATVAIAALRYMSSR